MRLFAQRQHRRVALREKKPFARQVAARNFQHFHGHVDADAALHSSVEQPRGLATAATQLGDGAERSRGERVEELPIEVGHIFLGVGIIQILHVLRDHAIVVRLLETTGVRQEFPGEQRNAGARYLVALGAVGGHQVVAVDMHDLPGLRRAQHRQEIAFEPRRNRR